MKIALVHDWLQNKLGGAENVLFELARLYPHADIVCLSYSSNKFDSHLKGRKIITSRLQKFPGFLRKRPMLLLPFIQKSVEQLDFSDYDLIISSSTAWVKNLNRPARAKHICYCHSPARMLWDSWPGYLQTQKLGPLKLGAVSRFFITKRVSQLRLWDYYNSNNVDEFVVNSHYIAARVKKFYGRGSQVIYPPINSSPGKQLQKSDFFLILSVLSQYKNIGLVIEAFKTNGRRLVIAGDGPDAARLRSLAEGSENIQFRGRVGEPEKWRLLNSAKALVFPSIEDFGITPVEAMSVGTPVIALRGGGLLETVQEAVSGLFFSKATETELNRAIESFDQLSFDRDKIIETTKQFSTEKFEREFTEFVDKVMGRSCCEPN